MSTGTQQGGQILPNETMNRTVDRTCTQKLTIPTLEKQDQANASMWWRKFVQYIKMTKEIDLSIMTNSKEILPQYRDQLETDIKDIFIWAIGQNAITEMNETTNDPNLLKTLVCLERQQHEMIPDEYQLHRRKLSGRFGLVFMEDRVIVPKNLRTTVISLLHKGHPAINKMTLAARHFWWPKMSDAIQKKCETCIPAKCLVRV